MEYSKLRNRLYDGIYQSKSEKEYDKIFKEIDCKKVAAKLKAEFLEYAQEASDFSLYGIPGFGRWEARIGRMMTVIHKIAERCAEQGGNLAQRLYRHSYIQKDRDAEEFMRILGEIDCDSHETKATYHYFVRQQKYYSVELSLASDGNEHEELSNNSHNFHRLAKAISNRCDRRFA